MPKFDVTRPSFSYKSYKKKSLDTSCNVVAAFHLAANTVYHSAFQKVMAVGRLVTEGDKHPLEVNGADIGFASVSVPWLSD